MSDELEQAAKDNHLRKYRYEIDTTVRSFFLNKLRSRISPDNRVLEIGSFDGYMTNLLLDYFSHVTVLEPVENLAENIRRKYGSRVTVHTSTIETSQIKEKFDWIFLIHVLEHLSNPELQLRKIANMLNKDGLLAILVPNGEALSRQIAVEMGLMTHIEEVTEGERLQGHLRTYRRSSLESDVKNAGIQIIDSGGVLVKPLANFQLDKAIELGIISNEYITALEKLSHKFPTLTSSIFVLGKRGSN